MKHKRGPRLHKRKLSEAKKARLIRLYQEPGMDWCRPLVMEVDYPNRDSFLYPDNKQPSILF